MYYVRYKNHLSVWPWQRHIQEPFWTTNTYIVISTNHTFLKLNQSPCYICIHMILLSLLEPYLSAATVREFYCTLHMNHHLTPLCVFSCIVLWLSHFSRVQKSMTSIKNLEVFTVLISSTPAKFVSFFGGRAKIGLKTPIYVLSEPTKGEVLQECLRLPWLKVLAPDLWWTHGTCKPVTGSSFVRPMIFKNRCSTLRGRRSPRNLVTKVIELPERSIS